MVALNYAPRALRDLDQIYRYSAQTWDTEHADRYVAGLTAEIERLRSFPELGQATVRRGVRRLVYERHVAFYRFAGERVVILRVISVRAAMPTGLTDDLQT